MSRRKQSGFDFLLLVPWYLTTVGVAINGRRPGGAEPIPSDEDPTAWRRAAITDPSEQPLCPECGGQMMQRTFPNSRDEFWACASAPKCEGAREIED